MFRRRSAAAVAAVILSMAAAGSVFALVPGTLDQKHECAPAGCTNSEDGVYPHWYSMNGSAVGSKVTLAQTFKAGITGKLTAVSLFVRGFDVSGVPATFDVHVVPTNGSGVPQAGTVLATGTVPSFSTSFGWVTATFASPPSVVKGTTYAIVLPDANWDNGDGGTIPPWLQWGLDYETGSVTYTDYAGGEAMASTMAAQTKTRVWDSMLNILSDGGTGHADFAFRTFVRANAVPTPTAFVPTQPPTDAAAAGPNGSTPISGALLFVLAGLSAVVVLAGVRPVRIRKR